MEQINNTISMISQIYEKFIQYSNEYPNSIVLMKYADLRDKIQSGWIYDNLDEFVATWNEVEIFCRPSRSSAVTEMPDEMPDEIELGLTRSTADQYYPNKTLSGYDELQGGDNTYGCSYNSYGGNVHVRELRPYRLGDENYPTSIINLSLDIEEGFQRQVSFVDNLLQDNNEGVQKQVSFNGNQTVMSMSELDLGSDDEDDKDDKMPELMDL